MKVRHTIEIVVDEDDVEEIANDFRKIHWNHRIGVYSYKSKTTKIPAYHCTYCKVEMVEKTSNGLCHDPVCTKLRQEDFNNKKRIYVDRWKDMMCNKCTDNNNEAYCYLNGHLVHGHSTCKGCQYDTLRPE